MCWALITCLTSFMPYHSPVEYGGTSASQGRTQNLRDRSLFPKAAQLKVLRLRAGCP